MRRSDIAFGVALLAIGYDFLPVPASIYLEWLAACVLLAVGGGIVVIGVYQLIKRDKPH